MGYRRWLLPLLLVGPILAVAPAAFAQDAFKVAIGQLEIWSGQAPILGQKAGIFKKYGITLENFGTAGAGETVQAVISGSADFGVNVGTQGVLRAFAKGAPIRVIGANFTGAGDIYFYVRADSPIGSLKDTTEKTSISYSTGGMPATLTAVMSGQVDIGWAAPPFGLREVDEGKIRVIASGNDVPSLRSQTIRVEVVNDSVLKNRRDACCASSAPSAKRSIGCMPTPKRSGCTPRRSRSRSRSRRRRSRNSSPRKPSSSTASWTSRGS